MSEVLNMQPGPELDKMIERIIFESDPETGYNHYSRNMGDAWEVVEHMQGQFSFEIRGEGSYLNPDFEVEVKFGGLTTEYTRAQTAPEAICKAALLAIEGKGERT